jgi:hypothetical protein
MYALLKRLLCPVHIDIGFKLVRLFGIFTSSYFYISKALKKTDGFIVDFLTYESVLCMGCTKMKFNFSRQCAN